MGKNLLLWLIIGVVLVTVFNTFNVSNEPPKETYSAFIREVQEGRVAAATFQGPELIATRRNNEQFKVVLPSVGDPKLLDYLLSANVNVEGKEPEEQSFWAQLLLASFPILIIIAVFMLLMRQMQGGLGGRGNPMTFGKSKARLLSEEQIKTTFADVAGVDEAKDDVLELVEFLRDPAKFQKLGGRIPRGTLMVGSPGTGKTLLARAIAGEAKVPFFSISGSDFVEMFVGVGASRVRDMFEQAKKQSPCIIFIDEIDAVGRHRGAGFGGGHDEREQTLNQLLVEMDGFEANDGIIVIAATNRPDVLDPAVAAARPFRPAGSGAAARYPRPRTDHESPYAQRAGVGQRGRLHHRPWHPRFLRCRLGERRQRGCAVRRPQRQEARGDGRLRQGEGQDHDGRGAQIHGDVRQGEAQHRLPRSWPRHRRPHGAGLRRALQDHHRAARSGHWA